MASIHWFDPAFQVSTNSAAGFSSRSRAKFAALIHRPIAWPRCSRRTAVPHCHTTCGRSGCHETVVNPANSPDGSWRATIWSLRSPRSSSCRSRSRNCSGVSCSSSRSRPSRGCVVHGGVDVDHRLEVFVGHNTVEGQQGVVRRLDLGVGDPAVDERLVDFGDTQPTSAIEIGVLAADSLKERLAARVFRRPSRERCSSVGFGGVDDLSRARFDQRPLGGAARRPRRRSRRGAGCRRCG